MKISFDVKDHLYLGLKRRLNYEGDVVVPEAKSEFALVDYFTNFSETKAPLCVKLPDFVVNNCGYVLYDIASPADVSYVLCRQFDGQSFFGNYLCGFPVFGKFNDNLGPLTLAGVSARYFKDNPTNVSVGTESLIEFLKNLNYRGYVSWVFGASNEILEIHLGLPYLLWYNVHRGMTVNFSEWLQTPLPLQEYWTLSLVVSRDNRKERTRLSTSQSLERSVYWLSDSCETDSVTIGPKEQLAVVCSWSPNLRDAQRRVLKVCRQLEIDGKLYRTDLASVVEDRMRKFREAVIG